VTALGRPLSGLRKRTSRVARGQKAPSGTSTTRILCALCTANVTYLHLCSFEKELIHDVQELEQENGAIKQENGKIKQENGKIKQENGEITQEASRYAAVGFSFIRPVFYFFFNLFVSVCNRKTIFCQLCALCVRSIARAPL
jgi:hypothetical protein